MFLLSLFFLLFSPTFQNIYEEKANEAIRKYQEGLMAKNSTILSEVLSDDFIIDNCGRIMNHTDIMDKLGIRYEKVEAVKITNLIFTIEKKEFKVVFNSSKSREIEGEVLFQAEWAENEQKFMLLSENQTNCSITPLISLSVNEYELMNEVRRVMLYDFNRAYRDKDRNTMMKHVVPYFTYTNCFNQTLNIDKIFKYISQFEPWIKVENNFLDEYRLDSLFSFKRNDFESIIEYTTQFNKTLGKYQMTHARPVECPKNLEKIRYFMVDEEEESHRILKRLMENYNKSIVMKDEKLFDSLFENRFSIIHFNETQETIWRNQLFKDVISDSRNWFDGKNSLKIWFESRNFEIGKGKIEFDIRNNKCSEKRLEAKFIQGVWKIVSEERTHCGKC
ncbi:unnamed protein product [Caenorhabditis angaria]|uniref:DUF38 domain-containing protein n=1 Tax=Caenorhabditis angaria TaxID=860376 RepID=A0A9P1N096_9PELO|nr:unnamed protein product [Caenorhabditis angaria]